MPRPMRWSEFVAAVNAALAADDNADKDPEIWYIEVNTPMHHEGDDIEEGYDTFEVRREVSDGSLVVRTYH